jgi:hypothetical protein
MARSRAVGKAIRIVSGGQTGVDRASLAWAVRRGLPYEGWCPKGWRAEDGTISFTLQASADTLDPTRPADRVERAGQRRHGHLFTIAQAVGRVAENARLVPGFRRSRVRIWWSSRTGIVCITMRQMKEIRASTVRFPAPTGAYQTSGSSTPPWELPAAFGP